MHPLILPLALALDFLFRDIEPWPHPVRLIGSFLDSLEKLARKQVVVSLRTAGGISLLLVCAATATITWFLIQLPLVGVLFSIYLVYSGLSLAGLYFAAQYIGNLVEKGEHLEARRELSLLVSRDTSGMDSQEMYKTLGETVSENINDGYVAPVFYLMLGGPVLQWIYKAVSTMDSMWGYSTTEWSQLGWAAARVEDALAFIPARITYFLAAIVAWALGKSWRQALFLTPGQARMMESPNAGWPMAACAWSVGAGMGGPASYFGQIKRKPVLGPPEQNWDGEKLQDLLRLILAIGLIWTAIGAAFIWLVW